MPEEESKEALRKKRTLFLLYGGAALLILPLLILAIAKLTGYSSSNSSQMDGSIFDARTNKIGSKIAPAPAPAAPLDPSGFATKNQHPLPAANPASSLGLIVGYPEQAPPKPVAIPKPAPQPVVKQKPKTLNQIKPQQPAQAQEAVMPKLKPSSFSGGSPIPQGSNVAPAPNTNNILNSVLQKIPQGQSVPPNIQQIIQQATQPGSAPQIPTPNNGQ